MAVYGKKLLVAGEGIRRKFQMLTDVPSGYVNVQSKTGIALRRLEQTEAFGRYDFGWGPEPWWIPELDYQKIIERNFPGCDLCSKAEMLERVPYSSWKAFWRGVTRVESTMHFYMDGPLVVTALTFLYCWRRAPPGCHGQPGRTRPGEGISSGVDQVIRIEDELK